MTIRVNFSNKALSYVQVTEAMEISICVQLFGVFLSSRSLNFVSFSKHLYTFINVGRLLNIGKKRGLAEIDHKAGEGERSGS